MKKILFLLLVMGLVISSGPVLAKDGFYIGGDLGIAVAPEMDMKGNDNDYDTPCDNHINPTGFQTNDNPGGLPQPPAVIADDDETQYAKDCSEVPKERHTLWFHNGIDGGTGILAGVALGYRLGSFRVEGEYFYRGTTYDSTAASTIVNDPETTRKVRRNSMHWMAQWMTCSRTTSSLTCTMTTARTRSLRRMWGWASGSRECHWIILACLNGKVIPP